MVKGQNQLIVKMVRDCSGASYQKFEKKNTLFVVQIRFFKWPTARAYQYHP